jgi:hypothetical protein
VQSCLQWDYKDVAGKTYRMPDEGPCLYPEPPYASPFGPAIVLKACELLGKKPKTLIHGDGHPGNFFRNKTTGEITWLDFQGYAVGPPGMDLAQGLGLGVQGASKEVIERMIRSYHVKLCEYGPPGVNDEYPFESCMEDFLLGMAVWYAG